MYKMEENKHKKKRKITVIIKRRKEEEEMERTESGRRIRGGDEGKDREKKERIR